MTYPATNSNDASKLLIDVSNQVHEVVNGGSKETVTTESGEIPTLRNVLADIAGIGTDTYLTKIPTVQYGSGWIVDLPSSSDEYPINQGVRYSEGGESAIYRFAGGVSELPYDLSQPFDPSKWVDANIVTSVDTFVVLATEGQFIFGPFYIESQQTELNTVNVYVEGKKQVEYNNSNQEGSYTVTSDGRVQLVGWTAEEDQIFEFEVNSIKAPPSSPYSFNEITDYTVGGSGIDITPGLQQAIIDSYNGTKPSTLVIPSDFYGELRSKSTIYSAISMYPGVTILMMPNSHIRNFVPAHMIRTEQSFPVGSKGWHIKGYRSSIIDHNSQAIDDLAADQLILVDQGDEDLPNNPGNTPNSLKKWSGYGDELYNGVFPKLFQYDGWLYGSSQKAQSYHCVWPENTKGSTLQGFTVRRSHKTSIRGSNTEDLEAINIFCDEPRSVGINISDNCVNPLVINPHVYSCLQIGIAVFDIDSGTTRGGIYGARCINDPNRPLGENGIEVQGNFPSENTGFVVDGFQIHHYGSHGLRSVNTSNCIYSNGIITSIAQTAVQQARYPNPEARVGFGLRHALDKTSRGNTVSNIIIRLGGTYEFAMQHPDNTVDNVLVSNSLNSASNGRALINDIEYENVGVLNLTKSGSLESPAYAFSSNPLLGFYQSGNDLTALTSAQGICARWGQGDFIAGSVSSLGSTATKGYLQIPRKIGSTYLTPENSFGGSVPFMFDDTNKRLLVFSNDGSYYSFDYDLNFNPDN